MTELFQNTTILIVKSAMLCVAILAIILPFVFIDKFVNRITKTTENKKKTIKEATKAAKLEDAKLTGEIGEELIYQILEERISSRYKILRNIYLRKENGRSTEIDMLVISGRGIYVIESKNRSGIIYGKRQEAQWTQFLNKKTKYPVYNPVIQNETHIKALKSYLKDYPNIQYFNIIVFSENCTLKVTDVHDAYLIKRNELNKTINEIVKTHKETISENEKEEIIKFLSMLSQSDSGIKEQHAEQMKKCPRCGNELTERQNKKTEEKFYGCKGYPKCRYTREISKNAEEAAHV